jgi:hypothetical protein
MGAAGALGGGCCGTGATPLPTKLEGRGVAPGAKQCPVPLQHCPYYKSLVTIPYPFHRTISNVIVIAPRGRNGLGLYLGIFFSGKYSRNLVQIILTSLHS